MPPPKKTTVCNPYAKKRKPPPNSHSGETARKETIVSTSNHDAGDALLPKSFTLRPGTFSQAFDSMDDTEYFRRASDSYNDIPTKKKESFRLVAKPKAKRKKTEFFDSTKNHAKDASKSSSLSCRDASGTGKGVAATNPEKESANEASLTTHKDDDLRIHHTMLQPHVLYVSTRQKGNSILPLIRNVPIAYSPMVPDYILGATVCALFLSIKYHKLYPRYIHRRIAELRDDFKLRILLVLVDVDDNANVLLQLNTICVTHQLTLILCWTELEAARYLETYKARDGKDAGCIQKKESTNPLDQVTDVLTSGPHSSVNKTDAVNLWNQFSTIQGIAKASPDELALVSGMGPRKVQRLHDALHKPFSKKRKHEAKQKSQTNDSKSNEGERIP